MINSIFYSLCALVIDMLYGMADDGALYLLYLYLTTLWLVADF